MERLKSVLADKIIEVSSANNEISRAQLDKLNRFRDFSFACEALMKKYDGIEDELIRMIQSDDFDTRLASTKVNHIISASEGADYTTPASVSVPLVDQHLVLEPIESSRDVVVTERVEDTVDQPEVSGANYTESEKVDFDYQKENETKKQLKRILIVVSVVAAVVAVYFAIRFVIKNWEAVLIVIGVIAAVGGLLWFFASKNNNNPIE